MIGKMKVKDVLQKYDGSFRIYEDNVKGEDILVADDNSAEDVLKKYQGKKVHHIFVADNCLEIYF